jgi:hypothetical protein
MSSEEYESLIQTAIKQAHDGVEPSLRAAAEANGLPPSTVKYRAAGRLPRNEAHPGLLSKYQEDQVIKTLKEVEIWGFPLRKDMLRSLVEAVAEFPAGQHELGKNWVDRFIKRQNLSAVFSRQLDCQRAFNNDPDICIQWFQFFRQTFLRFHIRHRNMYNFDEKGVLLGIAKTAKVILSAKDYRTRAFRKSVKQPGNRDSVSLIEGFCADGTVLPPFLIWKGKQHQSNWYTSSDSSDTRFGWTYAYSDNGWTDDELGVEYIKAFDRATAVRTGENEYRLLIMDNHSSHVSWKFIEFALSRRIVLLCLPPHSTHQLQPCDVGLFGPLQSAYGKGVDNYCRAGHTGVTKDAFLRLYEDAREKTFTKDNVLSAWRSTGLAPYNPTAVLKRLPSWVEARLEEKTSSDDTLQQAGSGMDLTEVKTPKSARELETLFQAINLSSTARPDGLLESPVKNKLDKLYKSAIQALTEAQIQKEQNKQFQVYEESKKPGKKLLSKARVLTQEDVDRLKEEEGDRLRVEAERVANRAYEEGAERPEEDTATYTHAVLNPGEARFPWAQQAHVFRCNVQPVGDGDIGLAAWNGRLKLMGGKGEKWGTSEETSPPPTRRGRSKK